MTRAMAKVWRVGVPAEGARAPGVRGGESCRVTSGSQTWHSMQRHPWFPSYDPDPLRFKWLDGGGSGSVASLGREGSGLQRTHCTRPLSSSLVQSDEL